MKATIGGVPEESKGFGIVNTSIADILGNYKLSDIDDDGTTAYIGYLKKDGAWYIQKLVISGTATTITYAAGTSGYDFSNRASETYNTFDVIF
jgi:hypothetical protein